MNKITIIIPVFNKKTEIRRCLKSLKDQTCRKFDLIIIDDASTDGSYDVVKEYKNFFPNLKIFKNNKNLGVSASRNIGINNCETEYLTFLDADDEFAPKHIQEFYRLLSEERFQCAVSDYVTINHNSQTKTHTKLHQKYLSDALTNYLKGKFLPNTNSWIIEKRVLDKFDLRFDTNFDWGEDMLFLLRFWMFVKRSCC